MANVYGRRFVYLVTMFIGFFQTYPALIGVRAVNGPFPMSTAIGPATVIELFFYHYRGRASTYSPSC